MLEPMRRWVDQRDGASTPSLGCVGRYQLIKPLAAGGMGEVFAACERDEHGFARVVALKRIRPQFSSDAEFVRMFLNEARLAVKLDHPNIVRVHDFSHGDDEHHLVMEYLHGASILEVMRVAASSGQALPLPHALTVVSNVLAGLHHAHELRGDDGRPLEVVHRDVSPGNILATYEGEVKILDFGIARAAQATQTAQGSRKGKVQYMSPEQCHGLPVDRRSDVFAVGIVLYELCTMRRPFRGDNEFAVMNAIVSGRFLPPSKVVDFAFPPELERLIVRALAVDKDVRFQTALEMKDAVEQVARSLSIELSLPALGQYVESLQGRRPWPTPPPVAELGPPLDTKVETAPGIEPGEALARPRRWSWVPIVGVAIAAVGLGAWWTRSPPAEGAAETSPEQAADAELSPELSAEPSPEQAADVELSPDQAADQAAELSADQAADQAAELSADQAEPAASSTGAPEARASAVAAPVADADPVPVPTASERSRSSSKSKRRSRARRPPADAASAPGTPSQSRDLRGIDGLLPSTQ